MRRENFDYLERHGIELKESAADENAIWVLEMHHPEWGRASLSARRNFPLPPEVLIDSDSHLLPNEAEEIKACGTSVQLIADGHKNHILHDRKNALLYLNAILGDDGVAAIDHVCQKFWHRGALEIETAHSADLDVEGIMTLHAVSAEGAMRQQGGPSENNIIWLHSHGLAEIGSNDFDVLNPGEDLLGIGCDLTRCIAFQILEGAVKPGGTFSPLSNRPDILAVPAEEFMEKAAPEYRALRDDPDHCHVENRLVLCDTRAGGIRAYFSAKPKPSTVLSEPFAEGSLIRFSTEASRLMAARAKATFPFFCSIAQELAEFNLTPIVKLAYETDDAQSDDDREHLWFEFHHFDGTKIDATLHNEPFNIARMKAGERGLHAPDTLTDWAIYTPGGQINPRSSKPLRFIRQNKELLREAMKGVEVP